MGVEKVIKTAVARLFLPVHIKIYIANYDGRKNQSLKKFQFIIESLMGNLGLSEKKVKDIDKA